MKLWQKIKTKVEGCRSVAGKYKFYGYVLKVLPILYASLILVGYIERLAIQDNPDCYISIGNGEEALYAPISILLGKVFGELPALAYPLIIAGAWLYSLCWRYYLIIFYLITHSAVRRCVLEGYVRFDYYEAVSYINTIFISIILFLIAELLIRTLLYEKVDRCANRTNGTK